MTTTMATTTITIVKAKIDLGEHGVLVDGSILHSSLAFPDYLLMLFKPLVQEVNLQGKSVRRFVRVKILQIDVSFHFFAVNGQSLFVKLTTKLR